MPTRCCVPGCNSNYNSTLKTEGIKSAFSFPKDVELRKKWLKALQMKEAPSKYSAVCELHFHPSEVMKFDSYLLPDGTVKRYRAILREDAVPSIFPNLPNWLRKMSTGRRKAKYQKQNQIELDEIIINYSEEESESFFSEKDFKSIMDLEVCIFCEDFLTSYHNLVRHCENTEEAIKNYRKQWGTNSRGLVKLSDVMELLTGDDSGCSISDDNNFIKCEITEEETLLEDATNETGQFDARNKKIPKNTFLENSSRMSKDCIQIKLEMYECDLCDYKTKRKRNLKQHQLVHKDWAEVETYVCKRCPFKSKYKSNLKKHAVFHKDIPEEYKCGHCEFQTTHKPSFDIHSLIHGTYKLVQPKGKPPARILYTYFHF